MNANTEVQAPKETLKFEGITLNIRNIDDEIDTEILHQAFSRFGTVLKAKIISELNKKRYGTVSFLSPADAANAISNMNGRVIISKTLYVSLDAPRTKQRRPSNPSMQRFAGLYKVDQNLSMDHFLNCTQYNRRAYTWSPNEIYQDDNIHTKHFETSHSS